MFKVFTTPARFNSNEIQFQIWKDDKRTNLGSKCLMSGSFFIDNWSERDLEYLGADIKALIIKEFRAIKSSKKFNQIPRSEYEE